MKKLTVVIVSMMLLLISAMPAFAEEENDQGPEIHECAGIIFNIPLTGELKGSINEGNYYLAGNCYTSGRVKVHGEVNICLNGYVIETTGSTTLQVEEDGILSLYDCTKEGHLGSLTSAKENYPLTLVAGGIANLYSVTIESEAGPMAVNNSGTLNIYDSVISCEGKKSDSIGIRNIGSVHFYGGEIDARIGVLMKSKGSECVFHSGTTTICSEKVAFSYASADRPVYAEGDVQPRIKLEADGEFTQMDFPSEEIIDSINYIAVSFETQTPENEQTAENITGKESPDGQTAEQLEEVPGDTAVQPGNITESTAEQDVKEQEADTAQETADSSVIEDKTEVRTEEETAVYETSENKMAYVVFGMIALLAAAAAAYVIYSMRKAK